MNDLHTCICVYIRVLARIFNPSGTNVVLVAPKAQVQRRSRCSGAKRLRGGGCGRGVSPLPRVAQELRLFNSYGGLRKAQKTPFSDTVYTSTRA